MLDSHFPTIDPKNPYKLIEMEKKVIKRLQSAFERCEKLQKHIQLLLNKGSLYKVFNNNLLYHGCLPMDENGKFIKVNIYGENYSGKALYDILETYVRKAFFSMDDTEKEKGRDLLWFIWSNRNSPLFGKDKMATFERYFLANLATHMEKKNPYYSKLNDEKIMNRILREFGLNSDGHIINGHVPVLQCDGESPVKCGGKVLAIDGGFSKTSQSKTGIAGYTLIYNFHGMVLVAHKPFTSTEEAIANETDIHSERIMVEMAPHWMHVGDTDNGRALKERIEELEELLAAYRSNMLIENHEKR